MATSKVKTSVYIDAQIKKEAQELLKKYGISLSEAFNIFLSQTVKQKSIPFEIEIPNSETIKVIKDARSGKNMSKVSLKELKEELNA